MPAALSLKEKSLTTGEDEITTTTEKGKYMNLVGPRMSRGRAPGGERTGPQGVFLAAPKQIQQAGSAQCHMSG